MVVKFSWDPVFELPAHLGKLGRVGRGATVQSGSPKGGVCTSHLAQVIVKKR